jgi:N-acetylmuramic acid 6-phosphate (MurNAc-6-P) etherase
VAEPQLRRADGRVKHAILMQLRRLDAAEADLLLAEHGGNLRACIGD